MLDAELECGIATTTAIDSEAVDELVRVLATAHKTPMNQH